MSTKAKPEKMYSYIQWWLHMFLFTQDIHIVQIPYFQLIDDSFMLSIRRSYWFSQTGQSMHVFFLNNNLVIFSLQDFFLQTPTWSMKGKLSWSHTLTSLTMDSTSVWRQTGSSLHTTCLLWIYILQQSQQRHCLLLLRMPIKHQHTPQVYRQHYV